MLALLRNLVKEIIVFGESKILFKRGIAGSSLARSFSPSTGCLSNEGNDLYIMGSKSSSWSTGDVPAGHVRRQQKIATHESDKRLCQAQWLRKALSCHFWCFF